MKKWKVLSTEYVVQNLPYNQTRRDRCLLPNGMEIDFYVHEYPNWVNAIVLTANMELVLVSQYRHGTRDFMIETPGGMVDAGESPIDAIVREVAEETGYHSKQAPIFLGEFFPNPATSGNKVSTYLFLDAERTEEQNLDSTEEISVKLVPFDTFGDIIREGPTIPIFAAMGYFLAKEFIETM